MTTGGGSGGFTGRIDAKEIQDQPAANFIRFAGPMEGTIRLGSLAGSDNEIRVPADGLKGQISLNAFNASQQWVEPVREGGALIGPVPGQSPPLSYDYAATSASLGGGAIGVVPFRLHRADSLPLLGPTDIIPRSAAPGPSNPIVLRHYGPVKAVGNPYTIEKRAADAAPGTPWIQMPMSGPGTCFQPVIGPTTQEPRTIKILAVEAFQAGWRYRVTLASTASERLECDGLPDGETAVNASDYTIEFVVCGPTPGDADDNGVVNFADITSVGNNYTATESPYSACSSATPTATGWSTSPIAPRSC